jgi:hypothetical protein
MGIQMKSDRKKFSQLRQTLLHLSSEIGDLVKPLFSDQPMIKDSVTLVSKSSASGAPLSVIAFKYFLSFAYQRRSS